MGEREVGGAPAGAAESVSVEEALTHEWLVTDGLGGYASGTVVGPHTRRYHGLLVAPLAPPLGRHILLSKLEETLVVGEREYRLGANEFEDGSISPRGYVHLADFTLEDGRPVWRYACDQVTLEKRVWMERGRTATCVSYRIDGLPSGPRATLRLAPLCSFREFHHETVGSDDWRFRVERTDQGLWVRPYAGAAPYLLSVAAPRGWTWGGHQGWWWHFLHREERSRGQDYLEDCFQAGEIACEVGAGETLVVTVSLEPGPPPTSPAGGASEGFEEQLRRAAHDFIVVRPIPGEDDSRTVLAGYHWFGDWGRDTFIALPGLALATGRHDECRAIVRTFARYVDRGMLPNRFPDSGAPLDDGDYNTIDASLWYVHAVDALDRLTGGGLVAEVYPVLSEIVDWHVKGTRFGIQVDPEDGLIRTDNPQLTWMDAKVGDWVCTPRDGKPVEIAALWHHALQLMEVWARLLGRRATEARKYSALRVKVAESFGRRFWNRADGYLYDTIDGSQDADVSFRPNQIIAAALPESPLTARQRKSIVDKVVSRLWTPRGLRTLDPADPRYRGRYEGDVWSRDGAYHQGTVWPWLLGPLVDAHLEVYGDKSKARRLIEPLTRHLMEEGCVGSINEIFDGDAPHAPRGAVAQAWSVAEVFRAWVNTVH
ncbi:MAG TPA: amylo-alpha-1,6-glucosidase [Chloroflexota bacterium]|nr:amylo-alpha-1,6-glucosidase [Chloroflexota bacterium]